MVFPKPSTAPPRPIPPKPPWYSAPTAIASLPTSLIESPTDTPATENCKNTSYDKIKNNNNDRPDDDDDDVDCFPRQDKQPVLQQQDISPTNTLPSLIESATDTSATIDCNIDNNNDRPDDDDDDDDVDCFPRQDKQPVLPQDISPTAPTANSSPPSLIESPTDKSTDTTDHDNDR